MDPKYIILHDVFDTAWCDALIGRISQTHEQAIGKDRYGRYDFLDKLLAKDIWGCLSLKIDVSCFKVGHRLIDTPT